MTTKEQERKVPGNRLRIFRSEIRRKIIRYMIQTAETGLRPCLDTMAMCSLMMTS